MNELTDLEICKRIAEIEQPKNLEFDSKGYPMIKVQSVSEYVDYDPLTDKALCFDLMVKHKIDMVYVGNWSAWCAVYDGGELCNANPQRAICLAVIAKHK